MEFRIIPNSRFDDVIDHLKKNFCDEPVCSSAGLVTRENTCTQLIKYYQAAMEEGMSVMAVDRKSGEVSEQLCSLTFEGYSRKFLSRIFSSKTVFRMPSSVKVQVNLQSIHY